MVRTWIPAPSPLDTLGYYKSLAATNGGADKVAEWSRMFLVPATLSELPWLFAWPRSESVTAIESAMPFIKRQNRSSQLRVGE